MRQLDLFGSLFNSPPPEEVKQEETKAVLKKEESPKVLEETPKTYYSIVEVAEDFRDYNVPKPVVTPVIERGNNETLVAKKVQPQKEPEIIKIKQQPIINTVVVPEEPEAIILKANPVTEKQLQVKETKITEVNFKEANIFKSEAVIVENQPKGNKGVTKTNSKIISNKKQTTLKKTSTPAPELETNGAVVFQDESISVKIKNKNPFTEVTKPREEKVKKEKVKKEPQKRGRKSFKEIDAEVDLIEIPDDETLFQKQYYTISEVAKWFRVNTSLLRFWENEFDVLKPRKNRKGDRLFRPEDVKNLELIYQLLRQKKYTVEGAKEYLKTHKKKADLQLHLTNTLQKFKSFLLDLKSNLQV